jgi:hypothetical protein
VPTVARGGGRQDAAADQARLGDGAEGGVPVASGDEKDEGQDGAAEEPDDSRHGMNEVQGENESMRKLRGSKEAV